jgi:NDP-sugar pyrophosphorylase family protein
LIGAQADAIRVYRSNAEFFDVGTPADYLATVSAIAAREHRSFDVGVDCRIAPDARIDRSVLWDRVTVGAGARVIDSVLADDVTVPDGTHIENQVLVSRPS